MIPPTLVVKCVDAGSIAGDGPFFMVASAEQIAFVRYGWMRLNGASEEPYDPDKVRRSDVRFVIVEHDDDLQVGDGPDPGIYTREQYIAFIDQEY
jgi:hypothetical protein